MKTQAQTAEFAGWPNGLAAFLERELKQSVSIL